MKELYDRQVSCYEGTQRAEHVKQVYLAAVKEAVKQMLQVCHWLPQNSYLTTIYLYSINSLDNKPILHCISCGLP